MVIKMTKKIKKSDVKSKLNSSKKNSKDKKKVKEIGGPAGPEPTRYGDWEVNGRVSDF